MHRDTSTAGRARHCAEEATENAHLEHKNEGLVLFVGSMTSKHNLIQCTPTGGTADPAGGNLHANTGDKHMDGIAVLF